MFCGKSNEAKCRVLVNNYTVQSSSRLFAKCVYFSVVERRFGNFKFLKLLKMIKTELTDCLWMKSELLAWCCLELIGAARVWHSSITGKRYFLNFCFF